MTHVLAFTPHSVDELASCICEANEHGQVLVPYGAGTRQHIGGPLPQGAQLLYIAGLDRVLEHEPGDMTVSVEAGISLGSLQTLLRSYNQWLPWDPPVAPEATVGGLLATGASGPLRLGYGTPRDWVLGMRVVLGDGRLVKSGGKVVKNVAGYDTHKLHIGAFGTLGVIAEVTCKVFPLPEHTATLLISVRDLDNAGQLAERLRGNPLGPVSLVVAHAPRLSNALHAPQGIFVAVRYAGVLAAVRRQADAAFRLAQAIGSTVVELGNDEADVLWQKLAHFSSPAEIQSPSDSAAALVIRTGVQSAALPQSLAVIQQHVAGAEAVEWVGYGGVGITYIRCTISPAASAVMLIANLRSALAPLGGYATVEYAPSWLHPSLDVWGPPPPTFHLMRSLKQQWDTRGILNPGRYIGRL